MGRWDYKALAGAELKDEVELALAGMVAFGSVSSAAAQGASAGDSMEKPKQTHEASAFSKTTHTGERRMKNTSGGIKPKGGVKDRGNALCIC